MKRMPVVFSAIGIVASLLALVQQVQAQAPTAADFQLEPPIVAEGSDPLVMLGLSVDHELFKKAYNDYSNLDGGALSTTDTTYRNDFNYYGYFDSSLCYTYSDGNARFEPTASAGDPISCPATGGYTTASAWSGNFLNWATMTRVDIVRKVLYGGKRSTDGAGLTVLERAQLPDDVHAFVKVYSGADIGNYTPYNSAISLCNVSDGADPEIRLANGEWRQWSASESEQCKWDGRTTRPDSGGGDENGDGVADQIHSGIVARVKVCVANQDADSDTCQTYSNGNVKPVGLLQRNGEAGDIRFGMITGSYANNDAGGILRKNISKIASNDDPADDEVDLDTGVFTNIDGIIKTLNNLKIVKWDGSRYSDCSTHSITVNTFLNSGDANRHCGDWGNPVSEIYLEGLRYFAGEASATAAFYADESALGWSSLQNWDDALDADEPCVNCAFIMLSSGMNSFDGDDLASVSDLPTLGDETDIDAYTDAIGDAEAGGDFTDSWLSGGADEVCAARNLDELSDASGICPERPALQGTYDIAGLAYYAHTTDIRTQLGFDGDQVVDSFMVELAESLPSFSANVSGTTITFLPACQANTNGGANNNSAGWQGCSLTDVQVESLTEVDGELVAGSYLIYWEDSHWGNDYDLDGVQRLEFCVGVACDVPVDADQIKIKSSTPYAFAGNALRFSYTVSGTDGDDGIVEPWALRPGGSNFDGLNAMQATPANVTEEEATFTAGASAATTIPRPLYLAAKYGGYKELDGVEGPTSNSEWDVKGQTGDFALDDDGNITGDGIPDNYYQLSNPALLETALNSIINSLKSSVTSSSAAAVVANTSSGEGAIFQGAYFPTFEASEFDSIRWPGMLHALFRDANGYFREDTDGDATLDDYSVDYMASFYYDENLDETRVQRFESADDGETFVLVDTINFKDFSSIWNARDELSNLTNAEVRVQRSDINGDYSGNAGDGRYIITGIDSDGDGTVQPDEVLDFDTVAIDPDDADPDTNYHRYFGLADDDADTASNIINFVRGDDSNASYRTRSVEFDSGRAGEEVWRLGDLVHSAPTSVSFPRARYDARYGDDTYRVFRQQYQKRRQVIYVGGNDGMLHAFNAGFYNSATKSFSTVGDDGETAHPLGAELWAYVPSAVLPHLQWLTSPDYGHIYYVDGSARIYDVNIFADDADHPGGWGTILVMGMRLGGGDYPLDTDGDGNADTTSRSSYLIMDITNPEEGPTLLAEIQRPPEDLMSVTVAGGAATYYATPPNVEINGGDGAGATAAAVLADTGVLLDNFVINDGGSGYSAGQSLSFDGDGENAVIIVDAVDANGAITALSVSNAGFGYSTLEVTATHGFDDAVLVAELGNGANSDKLKSIDITSGGTGYSIGDVLSISGDGVDATAVVADVDGDGAITDLTITNEGSGYTTIGIDSIERATGQIADISATLGFNVAAVVITDQGIGYTEVDSVTIDDSPYGGATPMANVSFSTLTWGYTTSAPVVVKQRAPDENGSFANPSKNKWYLMLGSGPSGEDALSDGTSDDPAKLFIYDLEELEFISSMEFETDAFTGNLAAIDWDDDFTDDAVYFGTVAVAAGAQSGNLKRLELDFSPIASSSLMTLLATDNPVIETPRLTPDGFGNRWVYSGTGRLLVTDDNSTNKTQYYYGILEEDPAATVNIGDMIDVTDIQVFTVDPEKFNTVNYVRDCPLPCNDPGASGDVTINGTDVTNWQELRNEILKTSGWYRELNLSLANTAAARTVGATNLVGSTLLFGEYAPSTDQCEPVGYSRINAVHYQTGTASPWAPVGVDDPIYNDDGDLVKTSTGITNTLSLLGGDGQGDADDAQGSGISVDDHGVLVDHSPGDDPAPFGRQSWQEININWDTGLND